MEVKEGIKYNSIESTIALAVSFFVNMFVICVFGAVSFKLSSGNVKSTINIAMGKLDH